MKTRNLMFLFFLALFIGANLAAAQTTFVEDPHSFSNPAAVNVTHVDLDWDVLFDKKIIKGTATLTVDRTDKNAPLILDTRDLTIEKVEASVDGKVFKKAEFNLGATDKILGAPLTVELPANAKFIRIYYSTSPTASGLQWLEPSQTAGKKSRYMFSQAEALHARSFVPLQDSPQVRVTYSAHVRTPTGLLAVMSAEGNSRTAARGGDYSFKMTNAIPPYLIAIAVGDLKFQSLGTRTGVYTEPSMLEKAAYELADTEKMVVAAETLYGPYRWKRYDLLVLPPSFPYGGMENPMLTFATPTILAGDRSLVSLVAHELAHSWSGNLVTNATWSDFWLNEGTTTYFERRIVEARYGTQSREMLAVLGRRTLDDMIAGLDDRDEILHVDLKGRDPDEDSTQIPYEKGSLFWRWLEESFGRQRFDAFLRGWFDSHRFQSVTTETFVAYLQKNLLDKYPKVVSRADVDEWIYKPGVPKNAPTPKSEAFSEVEAQTRDYVSGKIAAGAIKTETIRIRQDRGNRVKKGAMKTTPWSTQEWLHFLQGLPENLGAARMSELDKAFNFTKVGNSEIAFQWLLMSIKNDYRAAIPRLEEFLTTIGRRKFVRPLFAELAKTPGGMTLGCKIYAKARSGYHPITQKSVDAIVKCTAE